MKNRFYYSEKQATCLGKNDANELFNGKEWVKYSEWISTKGVNCNWDDAVLVFECEDGNVPEIKINPVKEEQQLLHDMMKICVKKHLPEVIIASAD